MASKEDTQGFFKIKKMRISKNKEILHQRALQRSKQNIMIATHKITLQFAYLNSLNQSNPIPNRIYS